MRYGCGECGARLVDDEKDMDLPHQATAKQLRQGYVCKKGAVAASCDVFCLKPEAFYRIVGQKKTSEDQYNPHKRCRKPVAVEDGDGDGADKVGAVAVAEKGKMSGAILCPSCNFKIGRYNWIGSNCTCGAFITPAFLIPKSKLFPEMPAYIPSLSLPAST